MWMRNILLFCFFGLPSYTVKKVSTPNRLALLGTSSVKYSPQHLLNSRYIINYIHMQDSCKTNLTSLLFFSKLSLYCKNLKGKKLGNCKIMLQTQVQAPRLEMPPEETTDLEELEQFAKMFKQKRIKLGTSSSAVSDWTTLSGPARISLDEMFQAIPRGMSA